MKKERLPGRLAHGYDIRIQREGQYFHDETLHDWAAEGEIPPKWEDIKSGNDQSIVHATLARNTQRNKWADKRRYIDEYAPGQAGQA